MKTSHFSIVSPENAADAVIEVLSQEVDKGESGEFAAFTIDKESITGKVKEGTCVCLITPLKEVLRFYQIVPV